MKKIALVIDFDPKINFNALNYENFDLFLIDRYNGKIDEAILNNSKSLIELEKLTLDELYNQISDDYQDIFCMFITYSHSDIADQLNKEQINLSKDEHQPKMYMFQLNYMNPSKTQIVNNAIDMIEAGHSIRDIIIRAHSYKNKEVFSINDLIIKYLSTYALK